MTNWTVVTCYACKFYNAHKRTCSEDRRPTPVRAFDWCGKGEKRDESKAG